MSTELGVPQAAVEAVLTHQWRAGDQRTEHDRHGYSEDCAVCQEWVPAILTVAAPVLLAYHLRGVADEMRDAAGWLDVRRVSDSASPGYVLAVVRAALEETARLLEAGRVYGEAAARGRPSSWDLLQGPVAPEAPTLTGDVVGEAVTVDG